ncbi:hypothetical protein VUR80DRAFT_202 [Thermomyces stellatus]
MKKAPGMDSFGSRDGLSGYEEDSLKRELPAAVVEQVLKGWPEEFVDQYIVVALLTEFRDIESY